MKHKQKVEKAKKALEKFSFVSISNKKVEVSIILASFLVDGDVLLAKAILAAKECGVLDVNVDAWVRYGYYDSIDDIYFNWYYK